MKSSARLPSIETAPPESKPYEPFGAVKELFRFHGDELIVSGPAGTGKSRGCLEKLYLCALKYPGMRGLMVRKTRESLTQSGMVTFETQVVPNNGQMKWRTQEQEYQLNNGSKIVVGGLDKASKIMSTDYDLIYAQEATELTQDDWESLTTRARFGVMPYNQVIGDCNPSFSSHWILARKSKGFLSLLESVHKDNPVYYDHKLNKWTKRGLDYLAKLDKLTGVRYLRLRKGIWASAEGLVYQEYSPDIHLINRIAIKPEWRRFITVDFGFTNPFVAQWWAVDDEDRMYRYREIYMTRRTVKEHAQQMQHLNDLGGDVIETVVCDWDAEDRATLEENGFHTEPAEKEIKFGIDKVKDRMLSIDQRPRIFFLRDSLVEVDQDLADAYKPTSTEQELEGYVWNASKDLPVAVDNHGCDATRYAVRYCDSYMGRRGGIFV